jgi:O-antigen ligase
MALSDSPRIIVTHPGLDEPVQDFLAMTLGIALSLALIMGIVEFSTAWFWPQNGVDYFFTIQRIGGGAFRSALWMVIALGFMGAVIRGPTYALLGGFAPLMAFWCLALLSSALGDDPANSLWFLTLWTAMACAALAIGTQTSGRQIGTVVAITFGVIALISLMLFVAKPEWATMQGNGKTLLRGLFMHKNTCGWFGAIGFLFLLSYTSGANLFRWGVLALCVAIALLSQSGTAVGMMMVGTAFLVLLRQLKQIRVTAAFKVFVVLAFIAAIALTINYVLPAITEALEKGQSLRNRESGWNLYLRFFEGHMVLGRGPGSFVTGTSVINKMISETFVNDVNMSVHSMYLALLGEVGVLGLTAFIGGYLYIVVIGSTQAQANRGDIAAALLALAVLGAGFTEARDTLVPNVATFLMLLSRASAVKQRYNEMRAQRVKLTRAEPAAA